MCETRFRFNATTAFLLLRMPRAGLWSRWCFNATTAFLLPGSAGGAPRKRSPVSMPPRRSCFSPSIPAARAARRRFQCHHGVPASSATVI